MSFDPFYPETEQQVQEAAAARKFIPGDIFTTVRKWAYTPTADFIVTRYGPRGFEFLLTKRTEAPWAGQWFFGGGRILPGETPEQGFVRGCERELGFAPNLYDAHLMLWQSIYNPECVHGGEAYFTMSACWQVWVEADVEISLDRTQSELCWFTPGEAAAIDLPVYVKNVIKHLRLDPARYHTVEG